MDAREKAIKKLKKVVERSPAEQTEALLLSENSSLTRFTPDSIHQHAAERNETLVLRVVVEKQIAVVNTNSLGTSSLKSTPQNATDLARLLPPNHDFVSLPKPKPIPPIETYAEQIRRLTPKNKVETIQQVLKMVGDKRCSASGAFSHGEVSVAVVNSLGVEAYQEYSDVFFHLIVRNGDSSGYASFVSRNPDELNPEELVKSAAAKASSDPPLSLDPGEYTVILEPEAVHELLFFLGYLGFNALSVQEGRSFFCNHIGEKLADEKVTIYDDGQDPRGLQVPFDFEGIPKQKVTFFDRGVASKVTYDSFTAGREGKESTGHALIPPSTEGPIPLNLFMEGGDSSLEEMVRNVKRGVYVTRFHYTNVAEPMKAVITGMTRDGTFLVEDGEMKRPLKNLRFTESILKALSRVKAVSRERKICSSGSVYGRRFVTGTVAPALLIDGFNFSGVSSME